MEREVDHEGNEDIGAVSMVGSHRMQKYSGINLTYI